MLQNRIIDLMHNYIKKCSYSEIKDIIVVMRFDKRKHLEKVGVLIVNRSET